MDLHYICQIVYSQSVARSGTLANIYIYTALMQPGDVVMGLDLFHGGHISHGYQTPTRPIVSNPRLLDFLLLSMAHNFPAF